MNREIRANQRNASIELFRVIMMFGICLLHVCGQGKYDCIWPKNLLCVAVVGFIFISGYFGVTFKLSKLLRLYFLAIFYCCLEPVLGGQCNSLYITAVLDAWRAREGYWFLHAYALLMLVSPLIEYRVDTRKSELGKMLSDMVMFSSIILLWSFLSGFSHLSRIVPKPIGMTNSGSFITMLGIYVGARAVGVCKVDRLISNRHAIIGAIVLVLFVSCSGRYLGSYASPFQFALAMYCFCLFKRMVIPTALSKVVLLVSPSMFAVYLIHAMIYFPCCRAGVYSYINYLRDPLIDCGVNNYVAYLYVACVVFGISLGIDFVRRFILCCFARKLRAASEYIDCIPAAMGNRLASLLANRDSIDEDVK